MALTFTWLNSHLRNRQKVETLVQTVLIRKWFVVLMDAGAETSSSSLQTFIISLLQNPESQRKAQEEIDRVIGGDHMPILDDFERLPYVKALVREVGHNCSQISSLITPYKPPPDSLIMPGAKQDIYLSSSGTPLHY